MDRRYLSVGNCHDEERIHAECAKASQGTIIEIGVLNGWTSRILANNTIHLVVGVDPLIPDSMNPNLIGSREKIAEVERDCNFDFVEDYSHEFSQWWKNHGSPIGYLFIDGDHVYDAVKQDFEDWFPFVLDGGYISIHDSAADRGGPMHWPGPSQLASELLRDSRVEYVSTTYCLTLFRKKNSENSL